MPLYRRRLGSIPHLLATNDLRVRIERGCQDLGWSLPIWEHPDELAPRLKSIGLQPDAYFQVLRVVGNQPRTAGFFVELERAGKSSAVPRNKLAKYGELYYTGLYREVFGVAGLRLLMVFDDAPGASPPDRRVQTTIEDARRLGITITRAATLAVLKNLPPTDCLTQPVWHQPRTAEPVALFPPPQPEWESRPHPSHGDAS